MGAQRDRAERTAAAAIDLAGAGGRRNMRIEIVEYDPAWPARFAAEVARLADIAPGLELRHIGSTAVPGLAAKPIIDMMALVGDLDAPLPALTDAAGYQYPIAYNDALSCRRWLCRPSPAYRTHHLHLVSEQDELDRHMRFRDALRSDANLAAAYAGLKRELAQQMPDDREGYTEAKCAFIDRVVGQARTAGKAGARS